MKKSILFIWLFFSLASTLSAQKIIKNEINAFSKVRYIATNGIFAGTHKGIGTGFVQFEAFDNIPRMVFSYYTGKKYRLKKNTKLELLDDKGDIFKFNCIDGGYSNSFIFFGDYEQLIGKNIIKYKLGDIIEDDIHKKRRAVFGELYQCLKNEILKHHSEVIIQPSTLEEIKKFSQDKLNEILNGKLDEALKKDSTISIQ